MIEKDITMAANLYYEEEKEVSGGLKKVLAIALIGIMLISDMSPAPVKFVKAEEQIQMVEEPEVMELTAEEPVSEEPVSEEPVSEEPVLEEPVSEEPVLEEPVLEEPVSEEPVSEEPVSEESAVEGATESGLEEEVTTEEESPSQEESTVSDNEIKIEEKKEEESSDEKDEEGDFQNTLSGNTLPESMVSEDTLSGNTLSGNNLDSNSDEIIELLPINVNGVKIIVSGPKSAFEEGTIVQAVEVEPIEEVIEAAEENEDRIVKRYKAFDITLHYNGEEVQPLNEKEINVRFEGDIFITDEEEEIVVYHIDQDNDIEKICSEIGENHKGSAEMTTTHFSTYMVAVVGEKEKVTVVINHYLGNEKKEENRLFLTDTYSDVEKGGSIVDFEKGAYIGEGNAADSFSVIQNGIKADSDKVKLTTDENGKKVLTIDSDKEEVVIDIFYQSNNRAALETGVTMFDYENGRASDSKSINYSGNYNNSSNNQRLATNGASGDYQVMVTPRGGGSKVNANAYNSANDKQVIEGLLGGLSGTDYEEVNFNYDDPGFFSKDSKTGKKIYDTYSIILERIGYRHQLKKVVEGNNDVVTDLNSFFPLNNKNGGEKNCYFGMRYDVTFEIGDYVGDMSYTFSGDDDLWVCLDGKVILDLGGIHGAVAGTVDLWEVLTGKSNVTYKDKENYLTQENKEKKHTITVLFMERGANLSNCEMSFVLPNLQTKEPVITAAPTIDIQFEKKDSVTKENIPAVGFTLYADQKCSIEKHYEKKSDKNGVVTFTGLRSGTYYLKETTYDKTKYMENDTVYVINVIQDNSKNMSYQILDSKGKEIENNTIFNTPNKGKLKITKTVDRVDEVHGTAAFMFKITTAEGKVLYRTISFESSNSEQTKSVVVDHIDVGICKVEELASIRYSSIGGTVKETTVVPDKTAGVEFTNEKDFDSYYSHSDVIVNKVVFAKDEEGNILGATLSQEKMSSDDARD